MRKKMPPVKELVRTFWYMYIKPTLARCGALSDETDQYNQLVEQLVGMVKEWRVMEYKDIGFRDDNRSNRKVGLNANVILYSEKLGHQDFLEEIAEKYQVSILALGGQPSVMNVEYFVDDLKSKGVNLQRSFFLFSIVDFDTSGWIVRNSFVDNLKRYGIKNINNSELIHPDMLLPDEILLARYPVRENEQTAKKNTAWIREVKKLQYENYDFIAPEKDRRGNRVVHGLEAESVSSKRLKQVLDGVLPSLLGKDEKLIKIMMLQDLRKSIQDLILQKIS